MKQVDAHTPIGTPVLVVKDDRSIVETVTRSEPWEIDSGDLLVKVGGIAGGYLAARCYVQSRSACPLPRIGSKEWGWRLVFDSIEGKWWTSDKLKYQIGYYRNRPFVIHPRRGNCAEPTTTSEAKRIAELLARRDWRRENRGKR